MIFSSTINLTIQGVNGKEFLWYVQPDVIKRLRFSLLPLSFIFASMDYSLPRSRSVFSMIIVYGSFSFNLQVLIKLIGTAECVVYVASRGRSKGSVMGFFTSLPQKCEHLKNISLIFVKFESIPSYSVSDQRH